MERVANGSVALGDASESRVFTGFASSGSLAAEIQLARTDDGKIQFSYRPPLVVDNATAAGLAQINIMASFRNPFEPWIHQTAANSVVPRDDDVVGGELGMIQRAYGTACMLARRGLLVAALPILATSTPTASDIASRPPFSDTLHPENDTASSIRHRLEHARSDLKEWLSVTQDDLANLIGIAPATLSNIAKPGRIPRASTARALFRVHAIASAIRNTMGEIDGGEWLRTVGVSALTTGRADSLELAVDSRLFPTQDRRVGDPTISVSPEAELLEIADAGLSFNVERI